MVDAQCPYCFSTDEVPDEYAGRVHKCLTCGKTFTIKFVPALYRESATPVVVTPKKAIHMGLPSGKPRANRDGSEQPIDAQSREIFAELTEAATADSHDAPLRKSDPREPGLVDELNALDSALLLVKGVVGVWMVGLVAFSVYAVVSGNYVPSLMALGTVVLLAVGLNLLRVNNQAFTNVVRVLYDVQRKANRAGDERMKDEG
jgi:hypothetical protein